MSATDSKTPIRVSGLNKSYGNFSVIRDLDLTLEASSIHGLVGLNGSGKTTTLECVLGLQQFDSGSVQVLGLDPSRLYRSQGAVVGIFDTPSLHPNLTVRQSLEHARILCKNPVRRCDEVEALLGITRYRDFKIRHLSLGNRRRASIAHGLLSDPSLIVLDEPFNGLDAEGVEDVLALIVSLNRDAGTTFLLSSHQLPYLEKICTHLAILHAGRIAVSNTVAQLFGGNRNRIQISCSDPHHASMLIDTSGLARVIEEDQNPLECELLTGSTADINRLLVTSGIDVSELLQKQESLTSLFHDITASDTPGDE